MCWIRERKLRSSRCLFHRVPVCFLAERGGSEIICSSHIDSQYTTPPFPKRTLYLCLKGRIWVAQAEAQGTSLHFMLASVFMCSQVVLLVSSQSGSCGVPRAPATKTLRRVFSLLWRQNREQTFQTPLIFPLCGSHPVGSPSRLPSLFCRLPLIFLSLSLSLASSTSVLISTSATSKHTCVERRPQIPGSGPNQAELGAAVAEEADPGGDWTPAQGGGTCAWRRWNEGDWPTPFPYNSPPPTRTQGLPSALPFFLFLFFPTRPTFSHCCDTVAATRASV